jgi:DNA-directed RNA polymerase specialized sigma24 family protein
MSNASGKDFDALVRQALEGADSQDRSQAVAALHQQLTNWARQLVRGGHDQLARDFIEQAPDVVIGERLSRYPRGGYFGPWAWDVLRNLWRDWRRYQRAKGETSASQVGDAEASPQAVLETAGGDDPAASTQSAEMAAEALGRQLAEIRDALDRMGWSPSRAVDTYAALLLQMRFVFAAQISSSGLSAAEAGFNSLSDWIAGLLPWHELERARRPAAQLPTIGQIWPALAQAIEQQAEPPEVQLLVDKINELAGSQTLGRNRWYQWQRRGRKLLRQAEPATYDRLLKPLLESRKSERDSA